VNGAGAATAVTYNLAQQKAAVTAAAGAGPTAAGTATPTASPTGGTGDGLPWSSAPPRRYRHHQNGTGM
jgi:hypothetical protein